MKVRALANISGPEWAHVIGDEFDVSQTLANELVEQNLVEAVEVETASVKASKPKKTSAVEQ